MAGQFSGKGSRSSGIGESKVFADPEGKGDGRDWSQLTIEGRKIPKSLWYVLPYPITDQGKAELLEGKTIAATTVVRDQDDKRVDKFRDDRIDKYLVGAKDPLQEGIEQHVPPGWHGMWLSERQMRDLGTVRGFLDYEILKVKNSETGLMEPVKQNGMVLAGVPLEAKAEADRLLAERNAQRTNAPRDDIRGKIDSQMVNVSTLETLGRRTGNRGDLDGLVVEDAAEVEAG